LSQRPERRGRFEKPVAILAALAVWQISAVVLDNSLVLVTPFVVAGRLADLVAQADFWLSVGFSLIRIAGGFLLAMVIGSLLAIAASQARAVEVLLWPYVALVKATPVASFIILCLIWLNASNLSVFISFLMVLPIAYTNLLHGIRSTDTQLLEMADVFQVGRLRRLRYIYLPHIKPYLLSASSIAIGLAWKSGIAAEVIGIPSGSIGEKLYEAKIYLNAGDLFAWTVTIVAVSLLVEKLFVHVMKTTLSRLEQV
jgi:NitT/TauT family transport system permease protein